MDRLWLRGAFTTRAGALVAAGQWDAQAAPASGRRTTANNPLAGSGREPLLKWLGTTFHMPRLKKARLYFVSLKVL